MPERLHMGTSEIGSSELVGKWDKEGKKQDHKMQANALHSPANKVSSCGRVRLQPPLGGLGGWWGRSHILA